MNDNQNNVVCTFYSALEHNFPGHPESPKRLQSVVEWLTDPPFPQIRWLQFQPAREADVTLVHRKELLEQLQAESRQGSHEFEPAPTYVTRDSYQAALNAVGATLAVSRRILDQGTGRGFAIVRPPGHHAESGAAMGFCLLNNIAIAAADAVASGLKRVAIIDIDAHHGNGTEAIFYFTPEVGYFSTHEGDIYPGTGGIESAENARGRIINIPLPAFSGYSTFFEVMESLAAPWLKRFRPEMLFVSVGYDAHFSDPLTTLTLDTKGYYLIAKKLVELSETYCQKRIMFVLEGGYDPVALRDNLHATLAALCDNDSFSDRYGRGPDQHVEFKSQIKTLREIHHLNEKEQ